MDPITQGLLGASAAQITTQHKLGRDAIFIGIAAGMAADLDILIRSANNPTIFITYHRHFTHALSFIPVGGWLIATLLLLVIPKLKAQSKAVFIAATAAYATHGLLDWTTSYGTLLFWPFSMRRVSLDWMSIIDPIFTTLIALGVILGAYKLNQKIVFCYLVLALCYMGLGAKQHQLALAEQAKLIASRGHKSIKRRAMPGFGQVVNWRSVYIAENKIYMDIIRVPFWGSNSSNTMGVIEHFNFSNFPKFKKPSWQRDIEIFDWFADGYLGVFSKSPFVLADMRYVMKTSPLTSLWAFIEPDEKRAHVLMKKYVTLDSYENRQM